jgi:hypothetical protein
VWGERQDAYKRAKRDLDALAVGEALLEELGDGGRRDVEHDGGAAGENAERALARARGGRGDGAERVDLERVPRAPARHALGGEVDGGVERLGADGRGGLVRERVQERALDRVQRRAREGVVQARRRAGRGAVPALGRRRGRAEEEPAEEDEREGAHLARVSPCMHRARAPARTTSVSAAQADWARASRYGSGLCASRSSTAFSALCVGVSGGGRRRRRAG